MQLKTGILESEKLFICFVAAWALPWESYSIFHRICFLFCKLELQIPILDWTLKKWMRQRMHSTKNLAGTQITSKGYFPHFRNSSLKNKEVGFIFMSFPEILITLNPDIQWIFKKFMKNRFVKGSLFWWNPMHSVFTAHFVFNVVLLKKSVWKGVTENGEEDSGTHTHERASEWERERAS